MTTTALPLPCIVFRSLSAGQHFYYAVTSNAGGLLTVGDGYACVADGSDSGLPGDAALYTIVDQTVYDPFPASDIIPGVSASAVGTDLVVVGYLGPVLP